jgi:hypothetical protein
MILQLTKIWEMWSVKVRRGDPKKEVRGLGSKDIPIRRIEERL